MYQFRRVLILRTEADKPAPGTDTHRVVFWHQLPARLQRRDMSRRSEVPDIEARELAAIRDGVLEELAFNVCMPSGTPPCERDHVLRQIWERQTIERLGELPREQSFEVSTDQCVTL